MKKIISMLCIMFLCVFLVGFVNVEAENDDSVIIYEGQGTISVVNDAFVLNYNGNDLELEEYDFYFKQHLTIENSYYIADVLEKTNEEIQISFFGVYYNNLTDDFSDANIHVFELETRYYFNLDVNLTADCVAKIISSSLEFDKIVDDNIESRLKDSIAFYSRIQEYNITIDDENSNEQSMYSLSGRRIFPGFEIVDSGGGGGSGGNNSSNDVPTPSGMPYVNTEYSYNSYGVDYDDYTNVDGIIHEYESQYFGICETEDGKITDDPIIQIIPKELFFQFGRHLYIGREYGFFVNTTIDILNSCDYAVDVVVFDIINTRPDFDNYVYSGSTKVVHLFEYKYRAVSRDTHGYWYDYDSNLDKVVFPHIHSDMIDYFIKNVSFKHFLENETALNPGDDGYIPNEDNGAFFIQTRLNYEGVGSLNYNSDFVEDLITYGFGHVPFYDELALLHSFLENIDYEYREEYHETDQININTYATNRHYQVQEYGCLLKQLSVLPNRISDNTVMFGDGNFIENVYLISFFNESIPTRYIDSISIEVGVDNTNLVSSLGGLSGFEAYASEVSYYASSKKAKIECNTETESSIEFIGDVAYYQFTPTITGEYAFETTGNLDSLLTLYCSCNNKLIHNDDGGTGTNGRIQYRLIKGETYFIKVQAYDISRTGDFKFLSMYDIYSANNLTENSDINVQIEADSFELFYLSPCSSENYSFTISGNFPNLSVILLDENLSTLEYNIVVNGQININCFLEAEKVYYLVIKNCSSETSSPILQVTLC